MREPHAVGSYTESPRLPILDQLGKLWLSLDMATERNPLIPKPTLRAVAKALVSPTMTPVDPSDPDAVKPVNKGGRPKGSKERKTIYSVEATLARLNFDPIEALARIAQNLDIETGEEYTHDVVIGKGDNAQVMEVSGYDPAIRLSAVRELAQYIAPKRSSVQHSTGAEEPFIFNVVTTDEAAKVKQTPSIPVAQEENNVSHPVLN